MNSSEVVEKLKELLNKESRENNLVVFDLDSTLFDVSWRTKEILKDCARQSEFQKKYPAASAKLEEVEVHSSDWGIKEAIIRSGIKESLSFFEEIRTFWMEHFFANKYLQFDRPYEGAVQFVNYFTEAGIPILYLTGRDNERMYEGSERSLVDWGFPAPDGDQVCLVMKNYRETGDHIFKRDVLLPIVKNYEETWFFENEPRIIELVQEDCPEVNIVFLKSVHSGYSKDPEHLLRLDSRFPSLD